MIDNNLKQIADDDFTEGGHLFSIVTVIDGDNVYLTKALFKPDAPTIERPPFAPIKVGEVEYTVVNADSDDVKDYINKADYFHNEVYPNIKKDMADYFESGKLEKYIKE